MVKVGSKYRETISILVKKLHDPLDMEVILKESTAEKHVCYFCRNQIPSGNKMFEIVYRHLDDKGRFVEDIYCADKNCIRVYLTKYISQKN